MDLRTLTADELDRLRVDVATEQERRANLASIPHQIEELAKKFRDGGGGEDALLDALTPEQVAALETA